MITVRHTIDFPAAYPLERLGPLSDLLFFDIETTGKAASDFPGNRRSR